ncbi:hypothetical protein MKW94_002826 [Papaver nudicaule]|uniref:RING-type domain-containing protein n=1 Tax=Papaver nudicaule TaxID=74823 RepID=A0AA41VXF1_PAPNU|nr:hypothetical protein [Papaver nudicaule]
MDYIEGISERLSVDAAAQLREAATDGVPVRIIDFVRISYKVEVSEFEQDIDTEDEVCCLICMDGVISGEDEVINLPCSHIFHSDCLVTWLDVDNSCPLCRCPVLCKLNLHGVEDYQDVF